MAYKKGGIVFPRVTDIIADSTNKSAGLVQWSANCAIEWIKENCEQDNFLSKKWWLIDKDELNKARFAYKEVSKEALSVGSEVHNAIEKWLQKKKYELTSRQAVTAFNAFLEWQAMVDLKPSALEFTVWGDRWAGTLDMVCKLNGKMYVIDWKTSKAFYPEMRYQVAAYRSAIKLTIEGCGILRLDKETGTPEWKDTSKTYLDDLRTWNSMVRLYFDRHPRIRARFEK